MAPVPSPTPNPAPEPRDGACADPVRAQYERFPYPPVPALALPARGTGQGLRWEVGAALAATAGHPVAPRHDGLRILVAGCGTLEGVVVAQGHPRAREVVAVDLSGAAIAALRRRLLLRRAADAVTLRRGLPPTATVAADLRRWEGGEFDYIVASNLLHHLPDPAALLARLASWLRPGGLLRLRTYPRHSRLWVRETGRWLRANGLGPDTPALVRAARAAVAVLPAGHPLRHAFAGHGDATTAAGLVDAYFHAVENPLAPLAWRAAAAAAGLTLVGEGQQAESQSGLLMELLPATAGLDRWERLQLLDDLLELSANPVLWLVRGGEPPATTPPPRPRPGPGSGGPRTLARGMTAETVAADPGGEWRLPSAAWWEMAAGVRRATPLLERVGVEVEEAVATLRRELGPRVAADGTPLPGLTLGEHDLTELAALPEPWGSAEWGALERAIGPARLRCGGEIPPAGPPAAQADWLQSRFGALTPWLPPLTIATGPYG